MKKLLLWILESKLTHNFILKVLPWWRITNWYAEIDGAQHMLGYRMLEPGDIIVTLDKHKIAAILIPGEWSHAAVCVGKGTPYEVAEMTHSGFTKSAFFDICKQSDKFAIYRMFKADSRYIQSFIERVKGYEGTAYDTTFSLGIKTLYCSELPYQADVEHKLQADIEDLAGLGRPYLSPTGLSKAEGLKLVFHSDWVRKA